MALAISSLANVGDVNNNTTIVTGSISPTANALLLIFLSNIATATRTHSSITTTCGGTGWSFTNQGEIEANDVGAYAHISVWSAVVPADVSAGTFTGTLGSATNRKTLAVVQLTGQHATFLGAIGEGSSTNSDTLSFTLSATPAVTSCVVGGVTN